MLRQLRRRCADAARRVLAAWHRFREFGFHSEREARGLALLKAWLSARTARAIPSVSAFRCHRLPQRQALPDSPWRQHECVRAQFPRPPAGRKVFCAQGQSRRRRCDAGAEDRTGNQRVRRVAGGENFFAALAYYSYGSVSRLPVGWVSRRRNPPSVHEERIGGLRSANPPYELISPERSGCLRSSRR